MLLKKVSVTLFVVATLCCLCGCVWGHPMPLPAEPQSAAAGSDAAAAASSSEPSQEMLERRDNAVTAETVRQAAMATYVEGTQVYVCIYVRCCVLMLNEDCLLFLVQF